MLKKTEDLLMVISSSNEIHPIVYPTSPLSSEAFSENMSRSNISLTEGPSFSSSNPLFLKYNNLNNNHNKAGSIPFSDSRGSINPPSSYMQAFPSQNTHPYYYPSYNYYPYSSGTSPYPSGSSLSFRSSSLSSVGIPNFLLFSTIIDSVFIDISTNFFCVSFGFYSLIRSFWSAILFTGTPSSLVSSSKVSLRTDTGTFN